MVTFMPLTLHNSQPGCSDGEEKITYSCWESNLHHPAHTQLPIFQQSFLLYAA
jgi:hypothetical protein